MAVVVTLVHGTFGRLPGTDARWAREGSPLRERLRAELGNDVVFVPFRWSGMNWPAARYRAAAGLKEHFRAVAERHAARSHYVVAHSHGGNVALYALRDAGRAGTELPRGAVCLSTPFIAAQPRPVTVFRFVATYAVLLVTLFAAVANVMGRVLGSWTAGLEPSDTVLNALLLNEVWLEFLLCAVVAWQGTRGLVRLARARRDRIAVDGIPVPITIYRSIGDEAAAVLATSSFLSWLGTLAWGLASAITIGVAGAFALLVLGPFVIVAAALLPVERRLGLDGLHRAWKRAARSRRFWGLVVTFGTMTAFALWGFFLARSPLGTAEMSYATFVTGLVLAVLSFSTLSGLGYGLTAPFLEVTAEATPVGSWPVHLFAARAWEREGPVGEARGGRAVSLSHSAAYADDGVLGAIAAWIREREHRGPE